MTQPITDSILLLRPQDIADVVTVGDAIDWVEQGYREASRNRAINQRAAASKPRRHASSVSSAVPTGSAPSAC